MCALAHTCWAGTPQSRAFPRLEPNLIGTLLAVRSGPRRRGEVFPPKHASAGLILRTRTRSLARTHVS
jgi:hypothetical protein